MSLSHWGIKPFLKRHFSENAVRRYHRVKRVARRLPRRVLAPHDLANLAAFHDCDKWGVHNYTPIYRKYFDPLRDRPLTLLEIGIGGYEDSKRGGASLRMWADYFPRARIYGVDIYDKSALDSARIKTFQGNQTDTVFLGEVLRLIGPPDIVIDDGSHVSDHVITTFEAIFPCLRPGGFYVVEDTQTSYWREFGGEMGSAARTTMNYFKGLADDLNYKEFRPADYTPTDFEKQAFAMHFYHNLIVVEKASA